MESRPGCEFFALLAKWNKKVKKKMILVLNLNIYSIVIGFLYVWSLLQDVFSVVYEMRTASPMIGLDSTALFPLRNRMYSIWICFSNSLVSMTFFNWFCWFSETFRLFYWSFWCIQLDAFRHVRRIVYYCFPYVWTVILRSDLIYIMLIPDLI